MSKKSAIKKLESLAEEFKQLLELTKCQKMYQLPCLEERTLEQIEEGIKWLQDAKGYLQNWKDVRNLQSEARWKWYENDPETFRGFREVVMHQDAVRVARKHLFTKDRPNIFKGKK